MIILGKPDIKKLKNCYSVSFLYYDKDKIKRRTKTKKLYVSNISDARKQAEEYRQLLEQQLNGITINSEMSFSDYLDSWQERRESQELLVKGRPVKEATLKRDRETEIPSIKNLLGEYKVSELTKVEIESARAELRKQKKSQSYRHHFDQKLNQILKQAVKDEVLFRNPYELVDMVAAAKPAPHEPLTKEQVSILVKDLKKDVEARKIVVWLTLATGMRRGEALGLKWKYVNLDEAVINLRYQVNDRNKVTDLKTDGSEREVPIDTETVKYLKEWKDFQSQFLNVTGETYVCSNDSLKHLSVGVFQKWRVNYFKKLGLEGKRLHDLRKTQATFLIAAGVDMKTVQARLGHTNIGTTMNIYTHTVKENEREAADIFGEFLSE